MSFSSNGFKNTKKEHPITEMNVTISGASGFGIVNKNKEIEKNINSNKN